MATDAQSLIDLSTCYACHSPGEWELIKLGLLKQILLEVNPNADTSVQGLLNTVTCEACHSPGEWQLLELALLKLIVQAV